MKKVNPGVSVGYSLPPVQLLATRDHIGNHRARACLGEEAQDLFSVRWRRLAELPNGILSARRFSDYMHVRQPVPMRKQGAAQRSHLVARLNSHFDKSISDLQLIGRGLGFVLQKVVHRFRKWRLCLN